MRGLLDDAILRYKDVAKKNCEAAEACYVNPYGCGYDEDVYCKCALDAVRLVNWLEDYKRMKDVLQALHSNLKVAEDARDEIDIDNTTQYYIATGYVLGMYCAIHAVEGDLL